MKIVLIVLGSLVLLVVGVVIWLVYRTIAGQRRAHRVLLAKISPVLESLERGEDPPVALLASFAEDRTTRKVLYQTLEANDRMHLFPARWLTWEAMAESDLVAWLCHPNELGSPPDHVECMAVVPAPDGSAGRYFVFRYRTEAPHWAATQGWVAGVAGPYDVSAVPVPHAPGTFSRFEPFESRTPEEHVALVHRQLTGRPHTEKVA